MTYVGLSQAEVLRKVELGQATMEWTEIKSAARGHHAVLQVSTDALKIDGVRVNVSAITQQKIADILGATLPTIKTATLAYEQAPIKIDAIEQALAKGEDDGYLADRRITEAVAGRVGMVRGPWKEWVLSNRLGWAKGIPAINFGFWDRKEARGEWLGHKLHQGPGTKHPGGNHTDYSQMATFLRRCCVLDGEDFDVLKLMVDPVLCDLVSDEGILRFTRQPGVPLP